MVCDGSAGSALVDAFTNFHLFLSKVFLSSIVMFKGLFSMKDEVRMMGVSFVLMEEGFGIGMAEIGCIRKGGSDY